MADIDLSKEGCERLRKKYGPIARHSSRPHDIETATDMLAALDMIDRLAAIERKQQKLLHDARAMIERLPNDKTFAYWGGVRDCVEKWTADAKEAGEKESKSEEEIDYNDPFR